MKKLNLLSIFFLIAIVASHAQTEGALNGLFSVSATQQVRFAQGNLQYQASTNTWRFAENQYDAIKKDNSKISATYDGWIDLFGWGTSGYDNKYPYMLSIDPTQYGNGTNEIEKTLYDWGLNNAISNGGNKAGLWRTPTLNEWYYIFMRRANADSLYGIACVNNINGLIVLPDNWVTPENLTFTPGIANNYDDEYKTINEYTLEQWKTLENLGALFLPTTGYIYIYESGGIDIYSANTHGYYWSSTSNKEEEAFMLNFGAAVATADAKFKRNKCSAVRLITDNTTPSTNTTNIDSTPINIYTTNNTLYLENLNSDYQIFTPHGNLIYSGNHPSITLPNGVYIIKTDNTIHKIVL
ncbi:MAG: hypothetical protein J6B65_06070 [Paludibacteraceae bacterium]|nr:hypothetical protein [Paludibacteraceae bacterium]